MNQYFRRIYAIAGLEWCQARRRIGFRLALVLIALPFIAPIVGNHHISPQSDDGGVGLLTFSVPYVALLAAFLVVPTYHREQRVRIAEILWTRPLDAVSYMEGKLVGALLIVGVLSLELVGLIAAYQMTGAGTVRVILASGLLLVLLPALMFSAVLYLACAVLLPHPVVGYFIAIIVCALFGFILSQDMLVLWNPWAQGLTYQPVLGFGPDLPLLLNNRVFFGGITLALAGGTLLLFRWHERRALRSGPPAVALALLIASAGAIGYAVPHFQSAAAAVWLSGPPIVPPTRSLTTHRYNLDLSVDPQTGQMRGIADFTIRNDARTPISMLPVFLNDGLHIQSATTNGRAAAIGRATLFGLIYLAPALAPGTRTTVRVKYVGQYKTLRVDYGGVHRFGLTPTLPDTGIPATQYLTYVRDGMVTLYGGGDWYPSPWTTKSLAHDPVPLDWHALRIRVPSTVTALASTPVTLMDGSEHIFSWTLHGWLPSAVLAIAPAGYAHVPSQEGMIYAPPMGQLALRRQYEPYVTAFRDVLHFMGHDQRRVSVIAVPFAGGTNGGCCNAGGVPVAVGGNLAIVPTYGLDLAQPDPANHYVQISALSASARYRAALEDVSFAWWGNVFSSRTVSIPYVSNPYPDLLTMGSIPNAAFVAAGYTGAAVAEQRDGTAVYRREIAWRRATDAFFRQRASSPRSDAVREYFDSSLGPMALKLGLFGRVPVIADIDGAPVLDDLRQHIGAQRLQQMLGALSRGAHVLDSPRAVACALSRTNQYPVGAWLAREAPDLMTAPMSGGCP